MGRARVRKIFYSIDLLTGHRARSAVRMSPPQVPNIEHKSSSGAISRLQVIFSFEAATFFVNSKPINAH